jgi:NAD(P)-dependent dehydrogenase (short-subunit alcohol dehydrogenase family)
MGRAMCQPGLRRPVYPPDHPRAEPTHRHASRGLGAVIAAQLAADGWAAAVNCHSDVDAARHVVGDIRAAGGTAEPFATDVTDEAQVLHLVEQVSQRLGTVDVLVISATGPQPQVWVEDLAWQAHLDQLVYFVNSPTLLVQAVLPQMKARRHGRIVQIGSDSFERALPGTSAKGAQLGLTRTWARELGPYNITVNLVAAGWIPSHCIAVGIVRKQPDSGRPAACLTSSPAIEMGM